MHFGTESGVETHEVVVGGNRDVDDLHGVEEETHVSGEPAVGPSLAERPRDTDFGGDLGREGDGLFGEVHVDTDPVELVGNQLGDIRDIFVDSNTGRLTAVDEGL